MGGILALTVRQKDGVTHKMSGWTNEFPYLINNVNIGNDNHFDAFIKRYHEDRKQPDNLYSHHDTLAPVEYGLVVVDYMTNNIVYINGYFTIGEFYSGTLYCAATNYGPPTVPAMLQMFSDRANGQECYTFGEFLAQKRITEVLQFKIEPGAQRGNYVPSQEYTADQVNNMPVEEFVAEFLQGDYEEVKGRRFKVQLADFTVTRYEESMEGFDKLEKHIQQLGFTLSTEDNEAWDEYIKIRYTEE